MKKTTKNILAIIISLIPVINIAQSYEIIDKDFRAGILSRDEAILQKFYLGFNSSNVLPNYKNSIDNRFKKCGTELIIEYHRNKNLLGSKVVDEIENILSTNKLFKVSSQTYTSPYGKFIITYETSGDNAVPLKDSNLNSIPDYVENVAKYFDYSWKKLIDTMGYLPPPIGSGKYKISFQNMEYYGYTNVDGSSTKSTYIVLHNNFIGFPSNDDPDGDQLGAAKVTAFHEFKHAIQIMYNFWNDPGWFLEMDATWAEDIGFNYVNDYYNYLSSSQIRQPGRSFENGSGYEDCLWMHFLSQSFGNKINKDIWQRRQVNGFEDVYQCFNNILLNYSSTFNTSLTKYFAWNFLTGDFTTNNLEGYKEASRYPTPSLCKDILQLPNNYDGCNRDKLSAAFISISPDANDRKIALSFYADFGINNFVVIIFYKNSQNTIEYINNGISTLNYLTDKSANEISKIILIPVNLSNGSLNYTFSGTIDYFVPAVFAHKKLKDTETESTRQVLIKLSTPFNYASKDSLKLFFGKETQSYTSVKMEKTSNTDEFFAEIPSQGYETRINYYFRTVDIDGHEYFYPETAPSTPFSFYVGKDVIPPLINFIPNGDEKSIHNFPQEIFAIIEDNIDIRSANLLIEYSNIVSNVEMIKVKDSLYFANMAVDSSLLAVGDKINFQILAYDVAQSLNSSTFPSEGTNTIYISDGVKYTSKPNLRIPDLNLVSKRDTIFINDNIEISDIDIEINITHKHPSDLELRLKTPLGNTSYIVSRPGLNQNINAENFIVTLDDEAFRNFDNPFLINTNQFKGHFIPTNLDLNSLSGINAKGAWILLAYDKASGEEGIINEWSLIIRKNKILGLSDDAKPRDFNIFSNYPNPFNSQTRINFVLAQSTVLSIKVFNILGEVVADLIHEKEFSSGNHILNFEASKLTSGIYFCKLISKDFSKTIKLMLLK